MTGSASTFHAERKKRASRQRTTLASPPTATTSVLLFTRMVRLSLAICSRSMKPLLFATGTTMAPDVIGFKSAKVLFSADRADPRRDRHARHHHRAPRRDRRQTPASASSAADLRAAASCGRACARGVWLPPFRGLSSRRAFHSDRGASSRGKHPRAASSSSAPSGLDRHCYREREPARGILFN